MRAPADWHPVAVRWVYSSGDEEWRLTAVFAMRRIRGFDDQILEALQSPNRNIHLEAVQAAGAWQLDAAWPHVVSMVQ